MEDLVAPAAAASMRQLPSEMYQRRYSGRPGDPSIHYGANWTSITTLVRPVAMYIELPLKLGLYSSCVLHLFQL